MRQRFIGFFFSAFCSKFLLSLTDYGYSHSIKILDVKYILVEVVIMIRQGIKEKFFPGKVRVCQIKHSK